MKNIDHPIDHLFRERLEGHQMAPSDAARKAFLKDAVALPVVKKKRRTGLILFSTMILITVSGIVSWLVFSPAQETEQHPGKEISTDIHRKKNHAEAAVSAKPTTYDAPSNGVAPNPSTTTTNNKTRKPEISSPVAVSAPISTLENKNNTDPGEKSSEIVENNTQQPVNEPLSIQPEPATANTLIKDNFTRSSVAMADPDPGSPEPSPQVVPIAEPKPIQMVDSVKQSLPDSDTIISEVTPESKNEKPGRKSSGSIISSLGVYYTPEWMFNTIEGGKFVNNFGLEGLFHYGPFSIRTGAGLSIAKGTNELSVEYNDYLGTYNKLDSMDFNWDDPSHQYLPTYYMTRQDVWDSLLKLDYPKVVKRYTYLQIPLIFGYDFLNREKFSLGFRVGPIMSVLLYSKQLSAEYDPGKNKIIANNDISPGQVNLNWQVMAGINGSMRLTETLKIEIEPGFRYYFNSVYEKPVNYAKPWSIGVRAAIIFNF
jgi:hypothetical protein